MIRLLCLLLIFTACGSGAGEQRAKAEGEAPWYTRIEVAHKRELWQQQEVLKMRIANYSRGELRFSGWMYLEANGMKSPLELDNGAVAVFDGEKAWVAPDTGMKRARFHLLTWPYFLKAPYKLSDPGTHLEDIGTRTLQGKQYPAARLTFDAGVGDTPDDWYIVYKHPQTNQLKALAYIVTYGKSMEKAEVNPHALLYDNFVMVNEIPIATEWTLWEWNEEKGATNQLGEIKLGSLSFISPKDELFKKPGGAVEDALPGKE